MNELFLKTQSCQSCRLLYKPCWVCQVIAFGFCCSKCFFCLFCFLLFHWSVICMGTSYTCVQSENKLITMLFKDAQTGMDSKQTAQFRVWSEMVLVRGQNSSCWILFKANVFPDENSIVWGSFKKCLSRCEGVKVKLWHFNPCSRWLGPTHCGLALPTHLTTPARGCRRPFRSDQRTPDLFRTFLSVASTEI